MNGTDDATREMNFQSEFLILPDQIDSLLTVETMRGFTENNLNAYCFTKRENCKRFCFFIRCKYFNLYLVYNTKALVHCVISSGKVADAASSKPKSEL